MKRTFPILAAIFFITLFSNFALQAQKAVVNTTNHSVTNVDYQIRLIEFILTTRLTVEQKESFFKAYKKEYSKMTIEEKKETLQATKLCKLLSDLEKKDLEETRLELAEAYHESALETPDDPAAELFLSLQNDSIKVVVENEGSNITLQSLKAFYEYLAFITQPENTEWYNAKTTDIVNGMMMRSFKDLPATDKESLEDFHITWYMIRAAWQNTKDSKTIAEWKKAFASCDLRAGQFPNMKQIRAALSDQIYGSMLDEAVSMGVEPYEWSSELNVRVW